MALVTTTRPALFGLSPDLFERVWNCAGGVKLALTCKALMDQLRELLAKKKHDIWEGAFPILSQTAPRSLYPYVMNMQASRVSLPFPSDFRPVFMCANTNNVYLWSRNFDTAYSFNPDRGFLLLRYQNPDNLPDFVAGIYGAFTLYANDRFVVVMKYVSFDHAGTTMHLVRAAMLDLGEMLWIRLPNFNYHAAIQMQPVVVDATPYTLQFMCYVNGVSRFFVASGTLTLDAEDYQYAGATGVRYTDITPESRTWGSFDKYHVVYTRHGMFCARDSDVFLLHNNFWYFIATLRYPCNYLFAVMDEFLLVKHADSRMFDVYRIALPRTLYPWPRDFHFLRDTLVKHGEIEITMYCEYVTPYCAMGSVIYMLPRTLRDGASFLACVHLWPSHRVWRFLGLTVTAGSDGVEVAVDADGRRYRSVKKSLVFGMSDARLVRGKGRRDVAKWLLVTKPNRKTITLEVVK